MFWNEGLLKNMGVVQRQGIKDSIITYFGVALGAVNTLFIYPLIPKEELGLIEFLLSSVMLLAPFVLLGVTNLVVRYFPVFEDAKTGHHGFLFFMLLLPSVGLLCLGLGLWIFQVPVQSFLSARDVLVQEYAWYIFPLLFFFVFSTLFTHYIKNFLRIVIPTLLENVLVKIGRGAITLLYCLSVIRFSDLVGGVVGVYGLTLLGLVAYTYWLGQLHVKPDFRFVSKPLVREMGVFSFYGVLGSIGDSLLEWIDKVMIVLLLSQEGLGRLGVFTIVMYIGSVVDVPRRSIEKITSPIVAQAIQRNDWAQVRELYHKTALNQFIIGCLLLLGIWVNLDSLFDLMPADKQALYRAEKLIILLLGMRYIFDMATGINSQIIAYSKYFRMGFYFTLALAVLNIGFNYLFIKTLALDIRGAALATLVSISLFNVIKLWFIYHKLHMQPFTVPMLWVLPIAGAAYMAAYWLPGLGHPVFDIIVRSAIVGSIYLFGIFYLRLSPDINGLILRLIEKLRSLRR